jgi:hypothetical protein
MRQVAIYNGISREDAELDKPLDESLSILKVRILQSGTIQPEGTAAGWWKRYIVAIPPTAREKSRHEGTDFEAHADPLSLPRTINGGCRSLRSTQREKALPSQSRNSHFEITRRNRKEDAPQASSLQMSWPFHDLDEGIRPEFAPPRAARHPALWRLRRHTHRGLETHRVPLADRRAFSGDLWRAGRRPVCRTRHLAGADAHQKKANHD